MDPAREAPKRASPLVVSEITATSALRRSLGRIDHLRFLEDVQAASKSLKGLGHLLGLDDTRRHRRGASPLVVTENAASRALCSAASHLRDLMFLEDVHATGKSHERTVVRRARLAVVRHLVASRANHAG